MDLSYIPIAEARGFTAILIFYDRKRKKPPSN